MRLTTRRPPPGHTRPVQVSGELHAETAGAFRGCVDDALEGSRFLVVDLPDPFPPSPQPPAPEVPLPFAEVVARARSRARDAEDRARVLAERQAALRRGQAVLTGTPTGRPGPPRW